MSNTIKQKHGRLAWVGVHAGLGIAALVALVPFLWLICASLKRGSDLFEYTFLPWGHLDRLTLENFASLLGENTFGRWLINSLFIASATTIMVVTLSSLGGFALAKYRFRGRRVVMAIMFATMLIPYQVLLPSLYELMYGFGWVNSYAAIIVPGAVSVFGLLLFRQAMQTVPDELLDAARVDGCSEFRIWWEIALPIIRPMIGAFTLLTFMASWNSFLWPQIILQDEGKYNLPIGLANMVALPQFRTEYGLLMAGTLLSILPVLILFFALQKDFIAGLSSGAVKG